MDPPRLQGARAASISFISRSTIRMATGACSKGSQRATGTPSGQRPQARRLGSPCRAGQPSDGVETVSPGVIAYLAGEIPHVDGAPE
jgi:hypothetical protein